MTDQQVLAEHGMELLRCFLADGRPDDLAGAIEALSAAVEHDRVAAEPSWRYALALALMQPAGPEPAPSDLSQAVRLLADVVGAAPDGQELPAELDIGRIAAGDPEWGPMLGVLLAAARTRATGYDLAQADIGELRGLLEALSQQPGAGADAAALASMGAGLLAMLEAVRTPAESDYGVPQAVAAVTSGGADAKLRRDAAKQLGIALAVRGFGTGDLTALRRAREVIERTQDEDASTDADDADLIMAVIDLDQALRRGDLAAVRELLGPAVERSDALTASGHPTPWTWMLAPFALALELTEPVLPATSVLPAEWAPDIGSAFSDALNRLTRELGSYAQALTGGDVEALRAETERLAQRITDLPGEPVPSLLAMAGIGMLELAAAGGPAEEAVTWNERALAALAGPHDAGWAEAAMRLATAHRLAGGDRGRSRQLGLDCLRGHAWQVMLQAGTDEAVQAAHRAAADAGTIASWCAADGAHDELVRVLEAGRGLVLHAATTDRRVTEQLRALGAEELAEEWQRAGGDSYHSLAGALPELESVRIPDDLRRRVLRRLEDAGTGRLLDPPDVAEIKQALARQQLSALLYLVPGSPSQPGMGVAVAPGRPVHVLPLPGLGAGAQSPLPAYERAHQAAGSATSADDPGRQAWRASLNELCDWAWQAVGEQLWSLCGSWWPGQTPRLVLVPVGSLALVPWPAARRLIGDRHRYLAEDVAISATPSGRLLCELAGRRVRPTASATVVANPTGDLEYAGIEAEVIHAAFYPDGAYLGLQRTPEGDWWPASQGAGTPQQLLELFDAGRAGHTLHLGCHAIAEPAQPSRSRLVLAGGQELPVRTLLGRRAERLELDRVFLAACTTRLSGLDYDEAFSLASAFLAAGARTVFGSLWQVADEPTSVLMYMVHHYLHAGYRPVDALHLAQRWMLDPGRPLPEDLPTELLGSAFADELTEPAAWAAFSHLGL